MAQIKKKFIAPDAVDGSKLKLLNGQALRGTTPEGLPFSILQLMPNGDVFFGPVPKVPVNPTHEQHVTTKQYVDNQVSGEAAARSSGDAGLQSQLDAEKSRIDAILSAATADKDSFAEIVALINSVDTENDSAFAGYVLSNDAALAQEVSDRQAGDAAETAARQAADSAEQAAREAADSNLQLQINALDSGSSASIAVEEAARIAADAAETAARQAADSAEEAARIAGDANLQSQVDAEKARIDAILLASDADKDSFAEIVSLINSVDTANDSAFASYVLSNNAALAQEIADRQAADTAEASVRATADFDLQDAIDAEVSARQAADQAEQSARQSADTTLQSNIDAEVAARQAATPQFAKTAATLTASHILDGVDLGHVAKEGSVCVSVDRLACHAGDDYTLSTVNGKTRVTFTSSFKASEEGPAAGDLFRCSYAYASGDQPAAPAGGAGGGAGAGDDAAAWAASPSFLLSYDAVNDGMSVIRGPGGQEPPAGMFTIELYDENGTVSPLYNQPLSFSGTSYPNHALTPVGARVWTILLPVVGSPQRPASGSSIKARIMHLGPTGPVLVRVSDNAATMP